MTIQDIKRPWLRKCALIAVVPIVFLIYAACGVYAAVTQTFEDIRDVWNG